VEEVRIDKWLWAARFFKTRGAATEAVAGGRVLLNGVRPKPAKEVRPRDVVEVRVRQTTWTVRVVGLADKRGSASAAAALYEETPESAALREQRAQQRRLATAPGADLGARPTKRDRRRLDALRKAMRDRGGGSA
jgi:ribosome-associated heat shock protein Hsp15